MERIGSGCVVIVKILLSSFKCKSRLLNIFAFRKYFLFVTLCALPIIAISSEIDPYSGIYKIDSNYQDYIVIKNNNNRYFGHAASGSVELVVDDEGKFRAKDRSIDITGRFAGREHTLMDL